MRTVWPQNCCLLTTDCWLLTCECTRLWRSPLLWFRCLVLLSSLGAFVEGELGISRIPEGAALCLRVSWGLEEENAPSESYTLHRRHSYSAQQSGNNEKAHPVLPAARRASERFVMCLLLTLHCLHSGTPRPEGREPAARRAQEPEARRCAAPACAPFFSFVIASRNRTRKRTRILRVALYLVLWRAVSSALESLLRLEKRTPSSCVICELVVSTFTSHSSSSARYRFISFRFPAPLSRYEYSTTTLNMQFANNCTLESNPVVGKQSSILANRHRRQCLNLEQFCVRVLSDLFISSTRARAHVLVLFAIIEPARAWANCEYTVPDTNIMNLSLFSFCFSFSCSAPFFLFVGAHFKSGAYERLPALDSFGFGLRFGRTRRCGLWLLDWSRVLSTRHKYEYMQ